MRRRKARPAPRSALPYAKARLVLGGRLMLKVGLCGFSMGMAAYPHHFPIVELQQTFYQPPSDKVLAGYRNKMPTGFEFTVKAWQLITHEGNSPTYRRLKQPLGEEERAMCGGFRDSRIVREALTRTLACAELVKASVVVFQCPASFRPDADRVQRLRDFFGSIANPIRPSMLRYAWEPRGSAWTERADLAHSLCNELELTYVVDPFVTRPRAVPGAPSYLRLHGTTGPRHVYSDAELEHLANAAPSDAYVMFNNIPRVTDAQRFLTLLRQRHDQP